MTDDLYAMAQSLLGKLPKNDLDPLLDQTERNKLEFILDGMGYQEYEGCIWQRQTHHPPSQLEVFTFGDPFRDETSHTYSTISDQDKYLQYIAACERRIHPFPSTLLPIVTSVGAVGLTAAAIKALTNFPQGYSFGVTVTGATIVALIGAALGIYCYSNGLQDYRRTDNLALHLSLGTRIIGRNALEAVLRPALSPVR